MPALLAAASVSLAAQTLRLVAAGDIMLSRGVAELTAEKGYDFPFAAMPAAMRGADITFANLECALTAGPPHQPGEMMFRAEPAAAAAIARAGFTVVSVANNHSPNFGPAGLESTFNALRAARVAWAGAGIDAASAAAPALLTVNGIRVAILAYTTATVVPDSYAAAAHRAGTAFMDIPAMRMAVASVRAKADLIIVSMHAGTEYAALPNHEQIAFAHAAIDAGADAVIGAHPHVVQTEESYHGKIIFYSLGNFVFDQNWSVATQQGLAVALTWRRDAEGIRLVGIERIPVRLHEDQPQVAGEAEGAHILARLEPVSSAHVWTAAVTRSSDGLPIVDVLVDGMPAKALLATGDPRGFVISPQMASTMPATASRLSIGGNLLDADSLDHDQVSVAALPSGYDVLLGWGYWKNFSLKIDVAAQAWAWSSAKIPMPRDSVITTLVTRSGLPLISVELDGRNAQAVFDTSTSTSSIDANISALAEGAYESHDTKIGGAALGNHLLIRRLTPSQLKVGAALVLGADLLSDHALYIDPSAGVLGWPRESIPH